MVTTFGESASDDGGTSEYILKSFRYTETGPYIESDEGEEGPLSMCGLRTVSYFDRPLRPHYIVRQRRRQCQQQAAAATTTGENI